MADWRTAPLTPPLRATLGFIEKMTLTPDELDAGDRVAVRAAGVSDEALIDAIHVCALFNMIVRLADSLGWDVPPSDALAARAGAARARLRTRPHRIGAAADAPRSRRSAPFPWGRSRRCREMRSVAGRRALGAGRRETSSERPTRWWPD